jgi:hypothetical protein
MAFPPALANLEAAVLDACETEQEWPAQVAAGVCAGIDHAIENPEVAELLAYEGGPKPKSLRRHERVIGRFAGLLRGRAPASERLPGSTDEALMAGMVGLVGDYLRIGRRERLEELRPELVLLTLLPYMGFSEAQRWADWAACRYST